MFINKCVIIPLMELLTIKKVIESQRKELEEKFLKETILQRKSLSSAIRFMQSPNILAILGVRRCGKSIAAVLLAREMNQAYGYINFDDERIGDINTQDLDKVLQAFYELYGEIELIILDEPQNVEKWELFANRLRRTKKVIITGSNSQLLSGELATALTGRHIDLKMFPFSFSETITFKPNFYLTEDIAKVKKEVDVYIGGSGFPEYYKFGSEMVVNIYEDIINKDCIRRHEIRNEKSFRELARYLISNFSSEFTYSRLSEVTGVKDIHTVKNYVDYLKQSFLIHILERFSFKLKQQIKAPKKVYVIDHGLINFVSFQHIQNSGRILENLVCGELLNRKSREYGLEVYYYKGPLGNEVDFVIKRGAKVKQLIQVCYDLSQAETKAREIKALLKASLELRCQNLLIITNDCDTEEEMEGKKIKFIPLWKWLLE